jgi:hypothetical protein
MSSKVDAVVGDIHGPTTPQAQSFTRAKMGEMYIGEAEIGPAQYHVYIFTISKREHVVEQAPLVPYLIVPACAPDEEYKLVIKIPHPMLQIERHPDKNEAVVYRHQAERVAQSLCNPDNPTLDQDFENKKSLAFGVNLNQQGMFWSKNSTPTKEELAAAHKRVERYYAQLIERARTLEIANPKELELLINQDYHLAAEHFGLETGWHRKLVQKIECPNCGEMLKRAGLAYHVNAAGLICVIDEARAAAALPQRNATSSPGSEVPKARSESPARGR